LAMILAAVWFFRVPEPVAQETPMASYELTEDDLEAYVLENVHEFDTEQLASLSTVEMEPLNEAANPETPVKKRSTPETLHPDDLDEILDEMTDEELEQIL
jgi:hypothetical protein